MDCNSKHTLFMPFMLESPMNAHAEMIHAHLVKPESYHKTTLVIASKCGVCEENFHEKMVNMRSLLITIDRQ